MIMFKLGKADRILQFFCGVPPDLFLFLSLLSLCQRRRTHQAVLQVFCVVFEFYFSSLYVEFDERAFLVSKGIIINRIPIRFWCTKAAFVYLCHFKPDFSFSLIIVQSKKRKFLHSSANDSMQMPKYETTRPVFLCLFITVEIHDIIRKLLDSQAEPI